MSDAESNSRPRAVDLARAPDFDLGVLKVRPAERLVEGSGISRELQPRVMQVLVALAEARPRVVSRDQLVEQCWGGRIVGDDALNRCILALRQLAKACSPEPFVIETVPRVGHRLIERDMVVSPDKLPAKAKRRMFGAIAALLLLVGVFAGGLWWWQRSIAREPASIAVLPFRSLSDNQPFFAEGVSEEILDQLAGEPAFRVAGRMAAAKYRNAADLREVGRALGVAYILEGSVQTEAGRVRINAALVKATDGMRLWSQTYDRKLDDIFTIQQSIGRSVAVALSRKLLADPAHAETTATNGEAYRAYLSARGMLRTRNPLLGDNAVTLLRQAVATDPDYAPAWASLAEAIRSNAALDGYEAVIAVLPEAEADARRAIALAPDLAEAHGVLGMLLGYRSHEAQAHLRRAGALDPHDAEAQLWLGTAERLSGNFEGEIAAYRRATELDPYWFRPGRDLAIAEAEMGDRAGAIAIGKKFIVDKPIRDALILRVAWLYGDFAQSTQGRVKGSRTDSIWQAPARNGLANARFTLGLPGAKPPPAPPPVAELRPNGGRFWLAGPPAPEVWRQQNRSVAAALIYDQQNRIAAKLMLNANRGKELLWGYDDAPGLLGIHRSDPIEAKDLDVVPLVALALRQVGRGSEANQMLSQAQALVDAIYRRGNVPFTFDVDAAAIAAAAGQRDRATTLLDRALHRGWSHSAPGDLIHFSEEPAFASLHDDPRFQAVVAWLDGQITRERKKAIALGL